MPRPFIPHELTTGPFTLAQASALGVTPAMLDGTSWRRMFRNVYVHAQVPDTVEMRARAVGLVVPREGFLWRRSAAWMYDVDVRRQRDLDGLEVGCRNRRRVRTRPGWQVAEMTLDAGDIHWVSGIPVTSPTRTGFDCARFLAVTDAVVVLDYLIRTEKTNVDEILIYASKQFHVRHKRRVPDILSLVDGRAESPPESRLRVWMMLDGLRPVPQYVVMDGDYFVARLDLALVEAKIAIEYDGEWHRDRMSADEQRRANLEALGWKVIKVYAADLASEAARRRLMARIHAEALRRR